MSKAKKAPTKLNWNEITYVVNNLPDKDLKAIDDIELSKEDISGFMTEQIESGGQFKLSWDYEWGDCPNLSLVYYFEDYPNSGFGISARGEDFDHCVTILMYKFNTVAGGKLYELTEARKQRRYG